MNAPKTAKRFIIRYPCISAATLICCFIILLLQIIQLTRG